MSLFDQEDSAVKGSFSFLASPYYFFFSETEFMCHLDLVTLHVICFTHFITCLFPAEVTNFVNPFDISWQI